MDDYQWWNDPGWVSDITFIARDLHEAYPDHKIISVGQSPAWITLSAGMIRKLRGEEANIAFVPFTGSFLERERPSDPDTSPKSLSAKFKEVASRPVCEKTKCDYQGFLNKLELSSSKIAEGLERGEKYMFCDLTRTGNGFASFISTWGENVDRRVCRFLGEDLKFLSLSGPATKDFTHFTLDDKIKVPINHYVLESDLFERLLDTSANNRTDASSSRLMATYQIYSTRTRPPGMHIPSNHMITAQIKDILHKDVQKREQKGWDAEECELS
ncbi:MAG: hypothetical protein ACLFR0_01435 [Alphaproteobacteria bacterium]